MEFLYLTEYQALQDNATCHLQSFKRFAKQGRQSCSSSRITTSTLFQATDQGCCPWFGLKHFRGGHTMNYFGEADCDHVFVTCHPGQALQLGIQGKGGIQERRAHLALAVTKLWLWWSNWWWQCWWRDDDEKETMKKLHMMKKLLGKPRNKKKR